MKQDLDEAVRLAQEPEGQDIFGRRVFPVVWVPGTASLSQVFGMDGCLYWAKSWDDPEEVNEGFELHVRLKPEYVTHFCEALLALGGHVKDNG